MIEQWALGSKSILPQNSQSATIFFRALERWDDFSLIHSISDIVHPQSGTHKKRPSPRAVSWTGEDRLWRMGVVGQTDPEMPFWESLPGKASLRKREEGSRSIFISITQMGQGEKLTRNRILTLPQRYVVGMNKYPPQGNRQNFI